jgi:hypothetical protein
MQIKITLASSEDAVAIHELQVLAYQAPARRYNDFTIPPLRQTIEELTAEFAYELVEIVRGLSRS